MKKSSLYLILGLFIFAYSCNNEPATPVSEAPVTRKTMQSEVNKTVAQLTITGMMCVDGCGGKIQQDLLSLKGVVETKLDFAESRPENIISVTFDPIILNEQEMITCVNSIADGAYRVASVQIIEYRGLQSSSGAGSDASIQVHDIGRLYQLLNLLQLVSTLAE